MSIRLKSMITNNTPDIKLLAAIAYGEASVLNDSEEVGGIAFAVANRARAWENKSISGVIQADPQYTYAANGTNVRFNLLMHATEEQIAKNPALQSAIEWAQAALEQSKPDPSNGALWWDGIDIKTGYSKHPKVKKGIKFSSPTHNIFGIEETKKTIVVFWKIRNKKTGKEVVSKERGRYDSVYISTAAHGQTIFWKYNPDFIKATGAKVYK